MADYSTEDGALLGNILRGLIQRGTGQSQAIERTKKREEQIKLGASPADIFASEEARKEQALAGQNVLGGIGAAFPGVAKAPIIGGLFSPGEPMEAPQRTFEEQEKQASSGREERRTVLAEEAGGRDKAMQPFAERKARAEAGKLEREETNPESQYKLLVDVQTELAAAAEAGEPITIDEAMKRARAGKIGVSAAGKDSPGARGQKVKLKKLENRMTQAQKRLDSAQRSSMAITPEGEKKVTEAATELELATRAYEDAADALAGSIEGAPAPGSAPAETSTSGMVPAGTVLVGADGKEMKLKSPASASEVAAGGYKVK